ncbi:hypothetical protein [Deinococcus sp. NW-56]|uniref:hypothetical protein n=1 Tax=Deinococcus sp. NW-56 TaxID=2080419 RepID=UPI000CF4E7DE|nr:hypothetical protein [Deinococcus sp. NW-56]
MRAYRLAHGAPLSEGEAAQLITRAALGEALPWAPVKEGPRYRLAHLATLTPQQLAQHAGRVSRCAQVLRGSPVPAALTA